jgi:uncharacterized membrane protein HdeD (DUF308 family)
MGIAERLRRLDDRILPRGKAVHFDSPKPWWFAYAGVFGAVFGVALVASPAMLDGTVRVVVFAVVLCLYVAYFMKVLTWRRRHKLPSGGSV